MKNFIPRVGIGYDVHAFDKKQEQNSSCSVTLCGIAVPHPYPILAHSDGDLVLHALTDAMLGSICAGSIGVHFPPSDMQWKNKPSIHFVKFAYNLIKEKGGIISNIDMTIICQAPKIMPHAMKMREYLSNELALSIDQINIKAVTTENLGAIGREEGIATQAICCVLMPYDESLF